MELSSGEGCQGDQGSPLQRDHGHGSQDNRDPVEVTAVVGTMTKKPRTRAQQQAEERFPRSDQDMKKKNRRRGNRRKTKNQGGFKGGDGENVLEKGKVDEMETPMNEVLQTSETQAPDQHQVQSPNPPQQPRPPDPPHPDQPKQPTHYAVPVHVKQAKKVQAHTQTRKSKGKNRATQTPRVVLTTQQTQTEPSDSTQPMAEDHTDSSQPTAEDHTDSSQAMADDHNDSSQPMAKDCPDSTQPMAEDHTVCFKPTAEDHTDSSQPTAGDHTDSSQANADDHNDSSQPMAEDCPDSSQPMGDDSTHTAVLLQNNIPGSTPLTNEQIRISDGVVNEGAALEPREEMKNKAESRKGVAPSGENQRNPTGDTPAVKGVEPGTKSYAEVAAENKRKTQKRSKELDPQTTDKKETTGSRERFPIRCPPAVPMFTFHIYAVLDKKFRFNQEHDTLLLYCGNEVFPLTIDYFIGKPQQGGYLVEASLSVEEHHIVPGQIMCYHYGVSQRQKYIIEIAKRNTKIPCDQGVKELHLYEGHINKMEGWNVTNWLKSWTKSKGTELSNAWKRSAEVLLDRVFDKFPLSYQEGSIIESLKHLHESFDSAVHRVLYPYNSTPPQIKISELISERLLLILRSEGASQKSRISSNPLLLGLSVFRVCIACGIDLGVKGWAELCHLVSSSTALGKKNIEGLQNDLPTSQFTVVGLINHLAKKTILELPLLIPLLHMLRQPGAESCRLGPTVEEGNWAGLDKVQFKTFRDNIRNVPDKRRMMLTLVQNHASVGKEMPLVWTSWLCLVAFEDILEFSTLTDAFPEHLIQSLLYRLQQLQENMENSRAKQNAEATENILCYVLKKVEEQKERLAESGVVKSVFGSCISVLQNTCKLMKLVPFYKAVVLSLQLVLKVAEIPAALPKEDVVDEESEESQVTDMLGNLQRQHLIPWRDNLLHNPILKECKSLSYPKEIEMWDAFFKVEYPLQTVSSQWRASLEKDLRKRISRASVVERVVLCCLDTSVKAIENSHDTIQTCFRDLCHSAVKTICQEGKERALLQTLSPLCNPLPSWILSSIVLGSAERFGNNPVSQLLDPESAVHHLLTQGDWKAIQVDAEAAEVLGSCQRALASLVEALCLGHVAVGHLETILKHREKFQKIYLQYRRNAKTNAVPANAEVILAQREKDLQAFKQQWEQVDTLIKMMGKVSDMITAPEIPSLKEQHRADLQSVSLSKLVEVQPCSLVQEEEQPASPGLGWWYTTSRVVLDMAREMHETRGSNLLLRSWVDRCLEVANDDLTRPIPIPMTLTQVYDIIWKPQLSRFLQLGFRIALESATFAQIDQALEASGDVGDGAQMRKELWLMSSRLLGHTELEPDWVEVRLGQIQEYRQLHQAAVLACVVLRIAERMELGGDFSEIHSLTQLEDGSFKQRALRSLSDDLIQAKQKLSSVTLQETKCLEAFLESQALVSWVQKHLQNMSDVKVFVELASISAGENDTEIDQVACFHDAVMGYGPFLYCLPPRAGFKEFMTSARQVWETLQRDQRLPDKLRDSCRLLAWLKGLRETHGSVEQSSLSLASAINAQGVYLVGWPEAHTDRQRCLQSLLVVIVRKDNEVKSYSLDNLVELQNKLMLMSSKGQHGKEQVNRFTQVFEGVQRLGHILLQMQSSGNMLFRQWKAQVQCSREKQPCIQLSFSSLRGKEIQYSGEVTEELQSLCRSMETCHMEWCALIGEKRSQFHTLNHYTSEQMVYLCKWIYSICVRRTRVPQQVWHLLSPINAGCTLKDMKEAFVLVTEKLTETQSGLPLLWNDDGDCVDDEYVSEQSEDFRSTGQNTDKRLGYNYKSTESHFEEVGDMIEFSDTEDEEETEDISPMAQRENEDNLDDLWRRFKENMPRYLTEHIDIATLARFLSCLSEMNRLWVKRKLPRALQEGKPNLILCSATEVLSTTLSFYMESPEQPLPSTDEILVCRENTSEEQVEIFLRRALGQGDGAVGSQQRIYTLVNPGLLGYDVSVGLGELFEELERTTGPNYRLVLVSPVTHQHRYVPSFFSIHKIQARVDITAERARRYLHHHFTVPSHSSVSGTYPDKLSVWVVSSARPAVGKSLYVERLFEKFQQTSPRAQYVRIRLIEPHVDLDSFIRTLSDRLALSGELDPVLLHVDTAAVNAGLEEFLFHFLVLGCLSDNKGMLWRRSLAHLMVIEVLSPRLTFQNQTHTKEIRVGLLDILPTIQCRPPKEVKQLLLNSRHTQTRTSLDPLMDQKEFASEGIQRPYQFLRRFNRNENLDPFYYREGSTEGDPIDCLHHLLENCGLKDPSWAELKNFTWFLNLQLKDCEKSVFCDPDFLADHLRGFKGFIVKFMIRMAQDFASPSIDSSDQSLSLLHQDDQEDDLLARLTIRKRWESESHPYIFFNADRFSMSFLGFHVMQSPRGKTLNAVDPQSHKVLMEDVMTHELQQGLERQGISLTEDFDGLPREDKIKRISCVVGARKGMMRGAFDPDPTYELTADNVTKMLAIHMRFRCGIPVIIMGETGCGKTRLVRFLCDLQREGRNVENMKLVKVHGGTTAEMIYRKVKEAERQAEINLAAHKLDTVLFFDEANTTESIFAVKEILCDRTVQGCPLKANTGLKIIAACNPYRRHSCEMVKRLERAGLGYRVKAGETEDRLGKVPLRQLVYRVHPLPPSMAPLVWDFGQLSNSTELSYIRQIVWKKSKDHNLPMECVHVISGVLAASQSYMRSRKNECSFVSLRDVERSMKVLVWFYQHSDDLFPASPELTCIQMTLKCLALAAGVCYYPSLVSKKQYLSAISQHFPEPLNNPESLMQEISACQDFFLQNIKTRETVAKNIALKENVFLMVVCIELRIPLFLVGKPGSSKSLAKTVVADAMQGQASHCPLFKKLKQVHMVSFQCSPHSSPEGIIGTFRNCARFQKDKNMDEYVSVVVLDEIGLAEDSPQMPLKTLHPLLEDGCIDNERPDPHMKVGFVGISNWALDPAKMNRGIFVSRWDPTESELVETAIGICSSSLPILLKIKHLFPPLAKAFLRICKETAKNQFFGLRDYYSLVKMLFATVRQFEQEPNDSQLAEAILRNFSGQPEGFDPVIFFRDVFQNLKEVPRPSTLQMVERNLDKGNQQESRYLLLLTTNNAALHILQKGVFAKVNNASPEIVFGSGFPKDQEYAQICRNVNRVKTCMETGHTVILLNLQNLYESLYDALNQYYVYLSGQQYVDLGLGSHRVKCRVHRDFRLVVIEDQTKVYTQFPVPLINRLEKHKVDRSTDLTPWQNRVLAKLKLWVQEFTGSPTLEDFQLSDVFVGFHGDACASALLQALEKMEQQRDQEFDQQHGKSGEGEAGEHSQVESADALGMDVDNDDDDVKVKIILMEKTENDVPMEIVDDEDGEQGWTPANREEGDMEIDADQDDVESSYVKDEEEEVFESAKSFLLNCATPDSVLRLKYTDLDNREKDRLQNVFFCKQHNCSLRDFMESHLNKSENPVRFIEVTTFSSLLTKFDVRGLAQALGVQAKTVLLLSLHQFDTEVSFCNKIRGFLQDDSQSLHILVVQVDIEESHCSDELIASAKYCTMNNLMTQNSYQSRFYVVFITKLSRIQSGGSHYIGFQGGVWLSVHIDDLRDTEDMSLNLSVFCGMPISKLLATAKSGMEPRVSIDEQAETETAHLHSLSLVRSCVQRAVGLLRDPRHVASRSMQRVHTLLELLDDSPGETGAVFQEVLLGRLAGALAVREELVHRPGDWLNREAKKRQALQEGGTLRHTLWRCLQSTLIPVLAHMVEVLDRYANLDLLSSPGLSQALKRLWLDILGDRQILDLTPPHNSSGSDQEVLLEHNLLLGEKERHCAVPFSWLIRKHFQSLWEESEFIPVATHESTQRVVQFVSIATNSKLGSLMEKLPEQERLDLGHRYLHDILLLSFRIKSEHELRVFTRAILGCVSELQVSMTTAPVLSPAWVMAAARHYAPRLETLAHTLLLQAQLAPEVLLQAKHMEPKEMTEDILALGICVEKSRLPTVTSLTECELYLGRVELLQPCLDRAFSQKYSNLCSPGCLQRLDTIRNIWCGMLVVAAFVQKVVFKMKHGVPRLVDGALKHCNLLQNLVQDGPNLRHMDTLQQLIRILNSYDQQGISTDLRSGIRCPVCLSELKEPSILPCSHVFCVTCLQCSLQADRHFCPECRQDLPPDFQPTVSQTIRSDLQQHAEIRGYCNSFFLEVVSRFCLSEGESPREGVVELLFSLLISSQGNVYRTRELTPFLECVDNSPVVRSVLPKLLLQYSFEQVKGHIQNYLWSLEENILEKEDRTELYLLLVNCFQDSLQCTRRSVVEEAKEQQRRLQDDTRFLGRLARKQTPGRREDPAGFLLSMARLRLCLGTAARLLQNESQTQGSASGSGNSVEAQYLSQVKAVCQYGGNDWYRVFLLRTINRQAGIDCLLSLMNTASPWVWAFPPEVLRLQRLLPAEVDRFLCCGPSYKAVRDGLTQALIQAHIDPLQSALQSVSGSEASAHVFLALALFRKVTSRYASPDSGLRPTTQEMSQLEDYLKIILSDKFREFCCMLLSNQIGGAGSPLHISQTVIAPRRLLLELLVHEVAVLLNGSTLLAPLLQIATQPQTMTGSYLPTMPDDHTTEAHQWLKRAGERNLKMYFCMNGHPCFVGECGRPVAVSKCPDCGVPVGGVQHNPVEGFTEAQQRIMDNTRMGHILGGAGHRTEAPERQMSLAQSCVLRLLTHLAMLQGAIRNHQAVNQMIHPGVRDVLGFLWLHLEKDVEVLGGTLDQNLDNTVVTVHLILQTCLSFTGGSHHTIPDLSSRRGREQWERLVCDEVINTVLKGLSRSLTEAQDNIGADDRLGGSPLMRLLHADPRPLLPQLPSASDCPTNHSSFWSLSENLTVERFFQRVDQEQGCKNVPLLALFLRKLQCVKQLRHLPELAALQSDLLIVCPFTADLTNQSIAQVLQQIPTGVQKKVLLGRLKVFMEVWNRLRMEVANNSADVGVSPQLCEKELTMESSGEFLSPQRHGPGSCLQILVHFLSETHNSLVTEARRLSYHDNSDFNVPLEEISETQLILCHPEKELLPLVLAHCHYTLRTGQLTDSFYDLQGIQAELARRFLAGKPRIRADMSKYLNRHHQDFSVVLDEVRAKIPQEALKGSVCTAMRTGLRSYTDVCDAVLAVEIGLRLLGKTDGDSDLPLLSYLTDSLKMGPQISCTVAKALGQSKLMHSTFTWQLLTCWKSEFMLSRGQDPFQRLPSEFQQKLSEEERKDMRVFFTGTDLATFSLELHEILLLKINQTSSNQAYLPKWDIRSTLESHLDQKRLPPLPGLDSLTENITLDKGADLWRMAVEFKKR
ncbi:E3 ubiquitin-protein ligase rnf213-beta isoform X3 [Esox lucius]|uniref:E3 ubiquitin-protein ligase rnf213-beta isoform X3 n=1 Tax=Esox lucius TaxID=8010 RepID=UPI0014771316|nr:E3 ubiquitin-protein ligase rnf213-beta isoform X3 [Esox lucius]